MAVLSFNCPLVNLNLWKENEQAVFHYYERISICSGRPIARLCHICRNPLHAADKSISKLSTSANPFPFCNSPLTTGHIAEGSGGRKGLLRLCEEICAVKSGVIFMEIYAHLN